MFQSTLKSVLEIRFWPEAAVFHRLHSADSVEKLPLQLLPTKSDADVEI
ncbi:hypothetical protein ACS8MQ_08715 [Pseudomonas sp. MAHUQ-62]